jgi:uncharacterized protein (DUF2336 family)
MRGAFAEIVALAKDRSPAGRRRLATGFGQAFFSHSADFNSEEKSIAYEILMVLLRDAELEIRRELAVHLAYEPSAPLGMVRMLAHDVIEVARPVLLSSQVLNENDLVDVISECEMAHRAAIAQRADLTENLCTLLVMRREPEVATALLGNIAVHLPAILLETLAKQAEQRFDIADLLLRRAEVTSELAAEMYWTVSNELRQQLIQRFDFPRAALDRALEKTVQALVMRDQDPASQRSLAEKLVKAGVVTPQWLLELARVRATHLFRDAFAGMTKLTPAALDALFQPEATEALALVCRALGFSKSDVSTMIILVRDRINGLSNFNPADLNDALQAYGRLSEGDAKTVLWQWQMDPTYLTQLHERRTLN